MQACGRVGPAPAPIRAIRCPVQTTRKQHRGDLSRPSVDELTNVTGSVYSLVNVAAKRARQLNAFHARLGEGLLEYGGPGVTLRVGEKPLSAAPREGLLGVRATGGL